MERERETERGGGELIKGEADDLTTITSYFFDIGILLFDLLAYTS